MENIGKEGKREKKAEEKPKHSVERRKVRIIKKCIF